jgi:hypothetical protein
MQALAKASLEQVRMMTAAELANRLEKSAEELQAGLGPT